MNNILIKSVKVVNEGRVFVSDILIRDGLIARIDPDISPPSNLKVKLIHAEGKHLFPGVIDDQVHFREPGLTHKGDIYSESKAAVAGGITSFMEMPNTIPNAVTRAALEEKYQLAKQKSLANYSFFFGATNDNAEELLRVDKKNVCGIKIFMGSSTGNMLVDQEQSLRNIFSRSEMLIAVHCEDEATVRKNQAVFRARYGEDIPVECHPLIRSEEACFKSSSLAVSLANEYGSRLHVLHVSSAKELQLFNNTIPLKQKRITAEVCIHHLWFDAGDYARLGNRIKWNPAIKNAADREALLAGLLDNHLDIIATDHAPHSLEEKEQSYFKAPSGGPLVQHALPAMLEFYHDGKLSLENIVEKMCHAPADCYQISRRGYLREGYHADLVLVNLHAPWTVDKSSILYKCGWSPFEGVAFRSSVYCTFVNGRLVFENGKWDEAVKGSRLTFSE